MITASEARALLANSKEALNSELSKIDKAIKSSAKKGENIVQYDLPSNEWASPIMSELSEAGYGVKQISPLTIQINF